MRERKCMDMAVDRHPHLSNLIHTPLGSYSWNDGWLTSATTLHITGETKIRNKYTTDLIYLNTSKHRALLSMAEVDGTLPVLFDFCTKDRAMLVVDLSAPGVVFSSITIYHRIQQRRITSAIAIYPRTSIVDVYPLSLWTH